MRHRYGAVVASASPHRDAGCLYETLDTSDVPAPDRKSRSRGSTVGQVAFGRDGTGGCYGHWLLVCVTFGGTMSGFRSGSGAAREPPLPETLFALHHQPDLSAPSADESEARGEYTDDKGVAGRQL
jgi:hypothetical protein